MTFIRVFQVPIEVVHEQFPANNGTVRVRHVAVQTVHSGVFESPLRVSTAAIQAVHNGIPSDQGTARIRNVSIQVVRTVAETGGAGGDRRSVILLVG